jgi:hypothetical protein
MGGRRGVKGDVGGQSTARRILYTAAHSPLMRMRGHSACTGTQGDDHPPPRLLPPSTHHHASFPHPPTQPHHTHTAPADGLPPPPPATGAPAPLAPAGPLVAPVRAGPGPPAGTACGAEPGSTTSSIFGARRLRMRWVATLSPLYFSRWGSLYLGDTVRLYWAVSPQGIRRGNRCGRAKDVEVGAGRAYASTWWRAFNIPYTKPLSHPEPCT